MRRSPLPLALALGLALALLAGCASNPYKTSYTSMLSDKVPKGEPVDLEPASGPPSLLTSKDMRADSIQLLEKGYRPIGRSKFRGEFVDSRSALAQAQLVGAEMVVVMQKFVSTETRSVAVMDYTPDRRIVTQDQTQTTSSAANDVPV